MCIYFIFIFWLASELEEKYNIVSKVTDKFGFKRVVEYLQEFLMNFSGASGM